MPWNSEDKPGIVTELSLSCVVLHHMLREIKG